jgi:hypothetical protein
VSIVLKNYNVQGSTAYADQVFATAVVIVIWTAACLLLSTGTRSVNRTPSVYTVLAAMHSSPVLGRSRPTRAFSSNPDGSDARRKFSARLLIPGTQCRRRARQTTAVQRRHLLSCGGCSRHHRGHAVGSVEPSRGSPVESAQASSSQAPPGTYRPRWPYYASLQPALSSGCQTWNRGCTAWGGVVSPGFPDANQMQSSFAVRERMTATATQQKN